ARHRRTARPSRRARSWFPALGAATMARSLQLGMAEPRSLARVRRGARPRLRCEPGYPARGHFAHAREFTTIPGRLRPDAFGQPSAARPVRHGVVAHLAERQVTIGRGLAGKTEHPFADDVPLDL